MRSRNDELKALIVSYFAKEFDANQVIIYYALRGGKYGYVSYGLNERIRIKTREVAEAFCDKVGEELAK